LARQVSRFQTGASAPIRRPAPVQAHTPRAKAFARPGGAATAPATEWEEF
jgi:hypothetical protein